MISCEKESRRVDTVPVPPRDLDAILADGKIKAVTNINQTSYFIYKGEPMGFHFELLKRFADHLDLELEIIARNDIDEALELLQDGEADLVAVGLSVSPDRKEMMRFTDPIMQSGEVLVQRKPNGWYKMSAENIGQKLVQEPG